MRSHSNNIPVNIPGHPYVLLNQSILCNCDIEAESNFLLESLAACEGPDAKTDLEMHLTVNLAFMNYFNDILENLGKQTSLNWTTEENIPPTSLETFEISDIEIKRISLIKRYETQTNQKKVTLDFNPF